MDSSNETSKDAVDDLCKNIPVLSDYAKGLDRHVKRWYVEKVSVIGIDPATIPREQLSDRGNWPSKLPSTGDQLLCKAAV